MTIDKADQILFKGLGLFAFVIVALVTLLVDTKIDAEYEQWNQEKRYRLEAAAKNLDTHGTPWDPTEGLTPGSIEHDMALRQVKFQLERQNERRKAPENQNEN